MKIHKRLNWCDQRIDYQQVFTTNATFKYQHRIWGSPKETLTTSELRIEFTCRNTIRTPLIFCTKGKSSSEDSKFPLGLVLNILYTLMIKTQYFDNLFNISQFIIIYFHNDIRKTCDLIYVNKCIKGINKFPYI